MPSQLDTRTYQPKLTTLGAGLFNPLIIEYHENLLGPTTAHPNRPARLDIARFDHYRAQFKVDVFGDGRLTWPPKHSDREWEYDFKNVFWPKDEATEAELQQLVPALTTP